MSDMGLGTKEAGLAKCKAWPTNSASRCRHPTLSSWRSFRTFCPIKVVRRKTTRRTTGSSSWRVCPTGPSSAPKEAKPRSLASTACPSPTRSWTRIGRPFASFWQLCAWPQSDEECLGAVGSWSRQSAGGQQRQQDGCEGGSSQDHPAPARQFGQHSTRHDGLCVQSRQPVARKNVVFRSAARGRSLQPDVGGAQVVGSDHLHL